MDENTEANRLTDLPKVIQLVRGWTKIDTEAAKFFVLFCFVFNLFIHLFIFGCVGSSFPCEGFL